MSPRSRQFKGFSLLEVLLVVVIVGILALAVGNWYGGRQPAAVKGTVNSLQGVLAEARTYARMNGQSVALTTTLTPAPNGIDQINSLAYPAVGQVGPQWIRSGDDGSTTAYSGISTASPWDYYSQAAPNPDPFAVPAIAALFTQGVNPKATGQLFLGGTNTAFSFDAEGRINRDAYVIVAGTRKGSDGKPMSYLSAPVGFILVTRANGIHAFYKPNAGDAASPWQRL